jgi:hypothetical protein
LFACPRYAKGAIKKRGIEGVKAVYSDTPAEVLESNNERVPASISYVPSVMGLIIAGEVIKAIALE